MPERKDLESLFFQLSEVQQYFILNLLEPTLQPFAILVTAEYSALEKSSEEFTEELPEELRIALNVLGNILKEAAKNIDSKDDQILRANILLSNELLPYQREYGRKNERKILALIKNSLQFPTLNTTFPGVKLGSSSKAPSRVRHLQEVSRHRRSSKNQNRKTS